MSEEHTPEPTTVPPFHGSENEPAEPSSEPTHNPEDQCMADAEEGAKPPMAPRYGGFHQRNLACMLDICLLAFIVITFSTTDGYEPQLVSTQSAMANLVTQVVYLLIYFFAWWMLVGNSPGKMLMGLRVVRAGDLEKPKLYQWILRLIGYPISGIPLLIGFFWMAFNERRRGWHDYLAGTVVVIDLCYHRAVWEWVKRRIADGFRRLTTQNRPHDRSGEE